MGLGSFAFSFAVYFEDNSAFTDAMYSRGDMVMRLLNTLEKYCASG